MKNQNTDWVMGDAARAQGGGARPKANAFTVLHSLRATRERLAIAEHKLRTVLEQIDDAVVDLDAEGRVQNWSHGAERLWGWQRQEVRGSHLADFAVGPSSRADFFSELARVRQDRQGREFIVRLQRRDGREFMAALRASPVIGPHGPQICLFVTEVPPAARPRLRVA